VNKAAWDELVFGDVAKEVGTPIEACFFKCIESTINIIRSHKPDDQVFIFFDEGTRTKTEDIARLYRQQAKKFPEISGIAFAPVEKVAALQGADLIATETFWYAQECMRDRENPTPRPHFQEFVNHALSAGIFFDRDHIEEVVARAKSMMAG